MCCRGLVFSAVMGVVAKVFELSCGVESSAIDVMSSLTIICSDWLMVVLGKWSVEE